MVVSISRPGRVFNWRSISSGPRVGDTLEGTAGDRVGSCHQKEGETRFAATQSPMESRHSFDVGNHRALVAGAGGEGRESREEEELGPGVWGPVGRGRLLDNLDFLADHTKFSERATVTSSVDSPRSVPGGFGEKINQAVSCSNGNVR